MGAYLCHFGHRVPGAYHWCAAPTDDRAHRLFDCPRFDHIWQQLQAEIHDDTQQHAAWIWEFLATGGLQYLLRFLRQFSVQPCPLLPSQSVVRRRAESWEVGFGSFLLGVVWGVGLISFLLVGLCEFPVGRPCFFFFSGGGPLVLGFLFPFLFLCLVRGGLGVLDHGAGLTVCFYFSFLTHYITRLDLPDIVHFVFDGPLHCHKVGKRSRLHDCMQVHGCNYGITHALDP